MEMEIKIAIEYLSKSIEAIETLKSEKDEGAMEYQKWQECTESMVRNIFGVPPSIKNCMNFFTLCIFVCHQEVLMSVRIIIDSMLIASKMLSVNCLAIKQF